MFAFHKSFIPSSRTLTQLFCINVNISSAALSRRHFVLPSFAPQSPSQSNTPLFTSQCQTLADYILEAKRTIVITGAGMSTDSGIPDYRGPRPQQQKLPEQMRARTVEEADASTPTIPTVTPISYQKFVEKPYNRRRYWARSAVGYERITNASPNTGHWILSQWRALSVNKHGLPLVHRIITQNVDSLHMRSSFPDEHTIELHGTLRTVSCMECRHRQNRDRFQTDLLDLNPTFYDSFRAQRDNLIVKPDGDIDLENVDFNAFQVPVCPKCNSQDAFRPDVVFFGENVPPVVTKQSLDWIDEADVVVVLGSTLTTFSSHRLVRKAKLEKNIPVIIVNIGQCRGDEFADLKIEHNVSEVLECVDKFL